MRHGESGSEPIIKQKSVANRTYRLAQLGASTNLTKIGALDDVSGFYVTAEAMEARGVAALSWVNDFPNCRYLVVEGAIRPKALTSETLSRLEVFEWHRKSRFELAFSEAPHLRWLVVPSDSQILDDADLPGLQSLAISSFGGSELVMIDRLADLRTLKLRGRRQVIDLGWESGAPKLQVVMLQDLYLRSLAGFEKVPSLQRLQAHPARRPPGDIVLDLRELSGCRDIEWLEIAPLGFLKNVDSVFDMPSLQGFFAYEGWYSPSVLPADGPLRSVPAPR